MTKPKALGGSGEARGEGRSDKAWYLRSRAEPWNAPPALAANSAPRPPGWLWTEPCSAVLLPQTLHPQAGSECSPCWHQASPHHGSWHPKLKNVGHGSVRFLSGYIVGHQIEAVFEHIKWKKSHALLQASLKTHFHLWITCFVPWFLLNG